MSAYVEMFSFPLGTFSLGRKPKKFSISIWISFSTLAKNAFIVIKIFQNTFRFQRQTVNISGNIKHLHGPKRQPQRGCKRYSQDLELLPKIIKERTISPHVPGRRKAKEMSKKAKAISVGLDFWKKGHHEIPFPSPVSPRPLDFCWSFAGGPTSTSCQLFSSLGDCE